MRAALPTVLLLTALSAASAQQTVLKYERPVPVPVFFVASQDTFLNLNEDSLIAASLSPVDTTLREPKSTTVATLASAVVPGAGQIYNESYWKAPAVWGLGYYFYSVYRNQDDLYRDYRMQYDTSITAALPRGNARFRELRDFHKRQRDMFGWYMAITYALNILDAYVDAALFSFDVSPNLQGTNDWRVRMTVPIR